MIRCQRRHLEARCRERGYTLDEVRACIVAEDGDTITVDETHKSFPRVRRGPSFVEKAVNFVTSTAKHLAAGMPAAADEEVARRFAICQQCQHFDGSACLKCGCPVVRQKRFVSKLSWANESCPVGKWGPEKPENPPKPS